MKTLSNSGNKEEDCQEKKSCEKIKAYDAIFGIGPAPDLHLAPIPVLSLTSSNYTVENQLSQFSVLMLELLSNFYALLFMIRKYYYLFGTSFTG